MDVAGWLVLGTKLETKQLEKNLKDEEKKLEQFGKKIEKLTSKSIKINAEIELKGKEFEQKIKEIEQKRDIKIAANTTGRMVDRRARDEKYRAEAQLQINKLQEEYNSYLDEADKTLGDIEQQITKTTTQQELTKNNIKNITNELSKKNNLNQIKNSATSIKNETEGILKKVAKWGLAIFSIRSAYLFIRRSVSTLSQYNEKLASDLEYIQFALASALQPVIETIIQLVYKLLAYVGYLAKAWFGVDLFAKASAKNFENAKKQLGGANKEAKQLQKTLAGFDEMNILQDGNTKTGGGGGGITLPSTDLGNFEDVEIPGWIQWLATNGELIKDIIIGIGLAIAGLKLTELVFGLSGIETTLPSILSSLSTMSGLQIFGLVSGIGVALVGVYETVKNLLIWIQDPTWENFSGVLSGLETVLIGVGIALVAVNAANPLGWVALAIGVIGKIVTELGREEKKTKDLTTAKKILNQTELEYANANKRYVNAVKERDKAHDELIKIEEKNRKSQGDLYKSGEELYRMVLFGETTYDKLSTANKETYLAYMNYLGAEASVTQATKDLSESEHDNIMAMLEVEAANAKTEESYNKLGKTINELIDNGKIDADDAYDLLSGLFQDLSGDAKVTFANEIPKSIKSSTNEAEKLRKKLKDIIDIYTNNPLLRGSMYTSSSSKTYSWAKGGVVTYAKGGIVKPIKLARGAVVNNPGPGVPITSHAIAGERGAEGVIPLTDAQQMDLLGSAIGRRVVVNLTSITEMNGRVIGKELKRIQNEEDFAFNG